MLCRKGTQELQTMSQTVEESANELIDMLCEVNDQPIECLDDDEFCEETEGAVSVCNLL